MDTVHESRTSRRLKHGRRAHGGRRARDGIYVYWSMCMATLLVVSGLPDLDLLVLRENLGMA